MKHKEKQKGIIQNANLKGNLTAQNTTLKFRVIRGVYSKK